MGRGRSTTAGGKTGGGNIPNPTEISSLISAREGKRTEVDQVLAALKYVSDKYGVQVEDVQIARWDKPVSAMAYYDANGNLAVNNAYFDARKMNAAYDECVRGGFHPKRGNVPAMEAVAAHEAGHRLTDVIGQRQGRTWDLDAVSEDIVHTAAKRTGMSVPTIRSRVSGYATKSNAEAVAEAFADVYCNGSRASRASRAIVSVLDERLGV